MAILHSSFHHGTGLFLIFCILGIPKDLSAAEVMICWKLFIISLIRAGLSSGFFLSELKRYVFLVNWPVFFSYMLFWLEVVLSCCAIVSVCEFYGKVVAVIWFF